MHLTRYTDYSLRTLIYLAVRDRDGARGPGGLARISDIAAAYGISENHLVKVVHHLGRLGLVETVRGRAGGLRLARPAAQIRIGAVVRDMEESLDLVECHGTSGACAITPACRLKGLLGEAMRAFMAVLDAATLADVVDDERRPKLGLLLGLAGIAERPAGPPV